MVAVNVKFSNESFAILVRVCHVTRAVDTLLFGDLAIAKSYCEARWKIPVNAWEAYLTYDDPQGAMWLNDRLVSYCGWKHDRDETETLYIHHEFVVSEF